MRGHDLTRRENAVVRLAAINPLSLTPLLPYSKWLGDVVVGASPINTASRQFSVQAKRDGLHVLELFGGIGLGVLRTALAAGYTIRCYTYVDRDPISTRIAASVLQALQRQYPTLLPNAGATEQAGATEHFYGVKALPTPANGDKWSSGLAGGQLGVPERKLCWTTTRRNGSVLPIPL